MQAAEKILQVIYYIRMYLCMLMAIFLALLLTYMYPHFIMARLLGINLNITYPWLWPSPLSCPCSSGEDGQQRENRKKHNV